jgi:hypothetical protein
MRNALYSSLTVLWIALSIPSVVLAQSESCRVAPVRGASQPGGAVASISMRNTGAACVLTMYGVPAENENPATSGRITKQPTNGKAVFVAPALSYTPAPGFIGQDEFEVEAWAAARSGAPLRLWVRVTVTVEGAQ